MYILLSLFMNEFHPFSRFPMYSSFPNWSYSFFITDSSNQFIPFKKVNISGGEMGHWFYSICESKKIKYGDGMESKQDLKLVGKEMMNLLWRRNDFSDNKKTDIKLYRLYYSYNADTIQKKYFILYDGSLEK